MLLVFYYQVAYYVTWFIFVLAPLGTLPYWQTGSHNQGMVPSGTSYLEVPVPDIRRQSGCIVVNDPSIASITEVDCNLFQDEDERLWVWLSTE